MEGADTASSSTEVTSLLCVASESPLPPQLFFGPHDQGEVDGFDMDAPFGLSGETAGAVGAKVAGEETTEAAAVEARAAPVLAVELEHAAAASTSSWFASLKIDFVSPHNHF